MSGLPAALLLVGLASPPHDTILGMGHPASFTKERGKTQRYNCVND